MADIDELLATAQEDTDNYAEESETVSALSDDNYTADSNYETASDYNDPNIIIINNKTIANTSEQITVEGDQRSQYIVFETDRIRDGIDLKDKVIKIHWLRPDGQGDNSSPVNVEYSADKIRFGWIVPPAATSIAGTLQFMPFASGTAPDGDTYLTQDLYSALTISETLSIDGGIVEPTESWYADFVAEMQTYVSDANTSATNAATSEKNAKTSETNAAASAKTATEKATAAGNRATAAATSETNAGNSATSASESADAAKTSATTASNAASAAKTSEANAKTSETNAKTSEDNASTYATNASNSADAAERSKTDMEADISNLATKDELAEKLDKLSDSDGNKYILSVEDGLLVITQIS